jgi:hypothetical protein
MSHTPGPWYLSRRGNGSIVCAKAAPLLGIQSGLFHLDVVARTDWGRGEEDEANARLIAAAPDMHAEIAHLRTALAEADTLWKEINTSQADRLSLQEAEIDRLRASNDLYAAENKRLFDEGVRLRREKAALVAALTNLRSALIEAPEKSPE